MKDYYFRKYMQIIIDNILPHFCVIYLFFKEEKEVHPRLRSGKRMNRLH